MSATPRLVLPLIQPAQAQKHITHNEALIRLDALCQLSLVALGLDAPPPDAAEGDAYGVGPAPQEAWQGQAGQIALRIGAGWEFVTPRPGWRAWDLSAGQLMRFDAGGWSPWAPLLQNIPGVGIATTSDDTNRLAVAAPASLFSHAGAGHQIKVNKAAAPDTASLLFQSGWTGHAEMGLAGDTAFSLKISADGSTWVTALRADPLSGQIVLDLPVAGQAVQQAATDATPGRLMRADWGYGRGNLLGPVSMAGGDPDGAVIERGQGATGDYVRWADGTQICRGEAVLVRVDTHRLETVWSFPAPFAAGAPTLAVTLADETATAVAAGDLGGPFAADAPGGARLRLHAASASAGFAGGDSVTARVLAVGRWV